MKDFLSKKARESVPYTAGEQLAMKTCVKLNANENPYPPSRKSRHQRDEETGETRRQDGSKESCRSCRYGRYNGFRRQERRIISRYERALTECKRSFYEKIAKTHSWITFLLTKKAKTVKIKSLSCFKEGVVGYAGNDFRLYTRYAEIITVFIRPLYSYRIIGTQDEHWKTQPRAHGKICAAHRGCGRTNSNVRFFGDGGKTL